MCRITDLRCKEVICVADGQRLGFITDVEVEVPSGQVCSIIVPGPCHIMGLFGRREEFIIPWNCIRKIGPDIVLVDIKPGECCFPRKNSGILF